MKTVIWILTASVGFTFNGLSQTAVIDSAWWTYQQDCNGDGCWAGTLAGDRARLNWQPDVTNCNGTVTVYEIVYAEPCGSSAWTAIYTNAAHSITGCRSTDAQFVDVGMGSNCVCKDYKIEIYQPLQTQPDYVRSGTNEANISQHREELLSQDLCLNDFFASCKRLDGGPGSVSANNQNATKEAGEPDHAGNAGGHSLWFCWTTTKATPVTFETLGSSFDTLLAVYTGASVSNLTLVAANDDIDGANDRMSRVTFTPAPGALYRVAVDGFGGAAGIVTVNWSQSGAARPDLIIWGPAASPTVSTRTFLPTDCEVVEGCETAGTHRLLNFNTETRNMGAGDLYLGNPATNSLFVWASCHGHYHFERFADYELLDGNGNVVASGHKVGFCVLDDHAWSPTANPQAKYDCWNQGIQPGWADVYVAGLPCQYIDITGITPGNYTLQMTINPDGLIAESNTNNNTTLVPVNIPPDYCLVGPFNDNLANGLVISNTPFTYSEINNCASKEIGEPNHAGNAGGHSIWFTWTPATNQTATITTKNSDFDTLLAVYASNLVFNLTGVASNDDIIPGVWQASEVTFAAAAGTTYHIAGDGRDGAGGTGGLNVNPPPNDDFETPTALSGTSGMTRENTTGASKQLNERAHAGDVGGHSVWYAWTAPASGPVDFNTAGSSLDTVLAVYTGQSLTNLTSIAANHNDVGGALTSRVDYNAAAGTNYLIAVDSYGIGAGTGNLVLNWNMDCKLGIAPLTTGEMQINLTGVQWQRYTLLGSTDLLAWSTNIPTATMMGEAHLFTNRPAGNHQFYRANRSP